MGFFDFITNIFSGKKKAKPTKEAARKKVVSKGAAKKKASAKKADAQAPAKKKKKKPTAEKSAKPKADEEKAAPKSRPRKKPKAKPTKLPFSFGGKPKKRKKSEQIKADPIDESSLGFSISLKHDDEQAKKRSALRITVKGLTVFIPRLNKRFPATDISATGLGFAFEKPRIKAGVKLSMDIYLGDECKAKDVNCKVMRHSGKSVGCAFIDLDRAQDDTIHEIVLLGQKQQAARKTARKDREFSLPS